MVVTAAKRGKTIKTATAEIERHAMNLRIRRKQLVQPDHYETIFLDKWEAEKYLKTRVLPQIRAMGLENGMDRLLLQLTD